MKMYGQKKMMKNMMTEEYDEMMMAKENAKNIQKKMIKNHEDR